MLPSHTQDVYGYSANEFYASTSDPLSFSFATGPPPMSADPNTPEMLQYNIRMALQRVNDIQTLARAGLEKIEHAWSLNPNSETNPLLAANDIITLRRLIDDLAALLAQSGVGALPLHPPTPLPDEGALLAETMSMIKELYSRQKQIQENNGIVASLLSVPESGRK